MMPSRAWPWWVLTSTLLISFPLVNFAYQMGVLEAGILPPYRDSPGPALFAGFVLFVLASPIILGFASLCLRRYNPDNRLLAWRRDRPWRSTLATAACLAGCVVLLREIANSLGHLSYWFDCLWLAYYSLWLPWLAGMRAAVVGQAG